MNLNDEMLVQCIRGDDQAKRNYALYQFYINEVIQNWMASCERNHPSLSGYIEDIFQEALIVFDRNIRENKFEGRSSLTTYLISILKWKVLGHQRQEKKVTEFAPEHVQDITESEEFHIISDEKKRTLEEALQQIDERCRELLTHYKLDFSMKEIASVMGFSSPEMAKKQAYRCREKLRTVLTSNPTFLQILKD